jgi:tetratricopeptide (TPR) repeat protein
MGVDSGVPHHRLIETLLELHRARRSCVVRLERGSLKRQLVLSQGDLAFAESNVAEEHLAHILMKLGYLSRKDLQKVSIQMRGGKSSEDAVVLAAALDGKKIEEGAREQALVILSSLFAWSGAEIRLYAGGGASRRSLQLCLPVPQVLVEAARRAVKEHRVPAAIVHLKGRIVAEPLTGVRSMIPLSRAEAFAYAQVKEVTPIQQLIPMIPSGDIKPEGLIQCLLLLGLLQLKAEASAQDAQTGGLTSSKLVEDVEGMLQRFEVANLYEILSVPPDAIENDIKAAYHEMAKLYHPDRFESKEYSSDFRARVEKLFTYITGAYTILSNPVARANFDETRLQKESQVEATLQGRAAVDADKEKMAETIFRAGRRSLITCEFEKAVSQFKECVWLFPDKARFHHFLGVAQSEIAPLRKEAERHLLKAIELESSHTESYVELGRLYLKVNLMKRAESHLYEALRWDPLNTEALKLLREIQGETSPSRSK